MTEVQLDSVCCTCRERNTSFQHRKLVTPARGRMRNVWERRHSSLYPTPCTLTNINAQVFPYVFLFWLFPQQTLPFSIVPAEPVSCHAQQFSSSNREVSLFLPFFTFSLLCLGPQVRGILTPFKKLVIGIGCKGYPVDHKGKKVWSSWRFSAPQCCQKAKVPTTP